MFQKFLIILIIYLFHKITLTRCFMVCSSVTIQGSITQNGLEKIKNCSIVVGHVKILNAKLNENNNSSASLAIFPKLVEITDYLLIFQIQNLKSLDKIFPNLAVIRGHNLFKKYALIIFLTNSLLQINLKTLIHIENGSILLSRLYHSCYINTIDWSYLTKDKQAIKPMITLTNNECFSQICSENCYNNNTNSNCWNEQNCQLKCPENCSNNCNLDNAQKCCNNSLCLYCIENGSCISCSKFRDLTNGNCVKSCPPNLLVYENHSCIKFDDCSMEVNSLVKKYHVFNNSHCLKQCPDDHEAFKINVKIDNKKSVNISKCIRCVDNICKKDCIDKSFILNTKSDLDSIQNCFRVKRLHIEFYTNISYEYLEKSLKYLEYIDDYLVITRNRFLNSLRFLQNLKLINGTNLFDKKYSIIVHTNNVLRELWNSNMKINGSIKFYENPELCYEDIERFILNLNIHSDLIAFNFNGYKRFSCSNRSIDLNIKLAQKQISVSWNINISDLRRLKGYILAYVEISDTFTFDKRDIDLIGTIYDDTLLEWNYLYIDFDESVFNKNGIIEAKLNDIQPFTRYALYVKADLTLDYNWINLDSNKNKNNKTLSFETDRLISQIHYIYSLPEKPDKIDSISYEPISYNLVNVKWTAPKKPNGIIDFYFISYKPLPDKENFMNQIDNCAYGNINKYTIDHYSSLNTYSGSVANLMKNDTKENEINLFKEKVLNNCAPSSYENYQNKLRKKMNDQEKNDLILVEDEIYNLAFTPIKNKIKSNKIFTTNLSKITIKTTTSNIIDNKNLLTKNGINYQINATSLYNEFYNLNQSLIDIIKRDFYFQDDDFEQSFRFFKVSNETFNILISNLTSFRRYIVSIISCQNFTHDLLNYSRNFQHAPNQINEIKSYLKTFPIENYCGKPRSITFRSLPDERLDQVIDSNIFDEDGITYFKWKQPKNPNGFIYKYNLRFIDLNLNKTHGPLCHANLTNLKVALNQFILTEGHKYLIQVQAVSTAGPGPWSIANVKYIVPVYSIYAVYIFIAICIVFFIFTIIGLIIFRIYTKSKERGYFSINSQYYYFRPDEWEIARENIIVGERIGSGCFAEVHVGQVKLKNDQLVDCAIKFCGSDEQSRLRLLKEANMMKSINTTHIVKLLGVVSRGNPAYLILEYMHKGDLKDYLKSFKEKKNNKDDPTKRISIQRFYRIAAEIADGMLWLSEHKYIHRDLAARNCLISKDDVIKIADLGLSKDIYQNPVYREKCKSLLPIRWMSPESLIDGSSTTKSDIWSYGVVLWEMSTYGDNPYSGRDNEDVIEYVKNGGRLELPIDAPIKFFTVMNKCMIKEDYKRICFKEIIDILDPDLTNDFKQTSYYHNDFKRKIAKRKNTQTSQDTVITELNFEKTQIHIANPTIDFDNYM